MPGNFRGGYNSLIVPAFSRIESFTTGGNNFAEVLTVGVTRVSSAVFAPIVTGRSADIRIQVAYEEPVSDDGETVDTTGLTFVDFAEQTAITAATTPESKKVLVRPFDTGVTACRVVVKPTVNNQAATGRIAYRGFHLGR